jgi:hypothetical protein
MAPSRSQRDIATSISLGSTQPHASAIRRPPRTSRALPAAIRYKWDLSLPIRSQPSETFRATDYVRRFENAYKFESYLGLTPGERSS